MTAIVVITLVGGVAMFFSVVSGWRPPSWSFAQYLLAALGMGLVVIVCDLLGELVVDSDRSDDPLWKRTLRVSIIMIFILVILGVGVWLKWKDLAAN